MKDIDILKMEEQLCYDIWEDNWHQEINKGNKYTNLNHIHVCDFELCNFKFCKTKRKLNKLVEKKCKDYLSSIGKERDEYMECCDYCIHDRYITISNDNPELILNICTSNLEESEGIEYLK